MVSVNPDELKGIVHTFRRPQNAQPSSTYAPEASPLIRDGGKASGFGTAKPLLRSEPDFPAQSEKVVPGHDWGGGWTCAVVVPFDCNTMPVAP